jgi:hypothetical protein
MPRLFFHLHHGSQILRDEEGKNCRNETEAVKYAMKSARSIVSADALEGHIDLERWIAIVDDNGVLVSRLLFHDAVTIHPSNKAS